MRYDEVGEGFKEFLCEFYLLKSGKVGQESDL